MSRLESALKLANIFAVFPIQPGQKVPLKGSKGFKDATMEHVQIHKWWADEPNLNIGISPGEHYVIFDFEGEAKGNDLKKSIKMFTRKTGHQLDLTDHLVVNTPSGGVHVYMKRSSCDARVYTSTTNFVKGCDIRASGGYVLGPGSTVDGKHYNVRTNMLPRTLPEELGLLLPVKRERVENNEADEKELDLKHNVKRVTAFLTDCEPAIEGEGGDAWTFATAAKCRSFGVSEAKCLSLMLRHFNPRCVPEWTAEEMEVKVSNAFDYALEKQGIDGGDPNMAFGEMVGEDDRTAGSPTRRFEVYTAAEMKAWPAPVWMIRKMIPERGIGFIIGPWGSYKTYIAVDLAACIACAEDFAGREFKRGGVVLYMAGEGPRGVGKRFEAWLQFMEIEPPDNLLLTDRLPNFGDVDEIKEFIAQFKDLNVVAVFIDTISMASLGGDENSSKDMGQVLAGMQAMRDGFGCFVMGIHHMGKDQSKGSRGWSGLPAAADVEIQVTADTDKKEAYVILNKSRDSERWEKKEVFSASKVTLDDDEDGDEVTQLAFRHNKDAKAPSARKVKDMTKWDEIKAILRSDEFAGKPLTQKTMAELLGPDWYPNIDFETEDGKKRGYINTHRILERLAKSPMGIIWTLDREKGELIEWLRPVGDEDPLPEEDPDDLIDW